MSVLRLPMLYAFAGGCLCSAALFSVWRAGESAGAAAAQQQRPTRNVEQVTANITTPSSALSAEQPHDPGALEAADAADHATGEPAASSAAQDLASDGSTSPESVAVSDVLTRLEVAYRERVAVAAPAAPASSTEEHENAAAPANSAIATAQPAPDATPRPEAAGIPVSAEPAVAVVAPAVVAPAVVAPAVVAPAAVPPQIPVAPAFVAQNAPPPTEVHYGDVNQNTYITNVQQGDVYLIQMQQLAMLRYSQLPGRSAGSPAPARQGRAAAPQRTFFPSTLINPDNPWHFNFAPPNLVH